MSRFIIYTLLIALAGAVLWQAELLPFWSACSRPVAYSVGTADERFGLSEAELLRVARDAERIWEEEFERDFFEYDPESEFTVNLIFDDRQQATQDAEELERELEETKRKHEELETRYRDVRARYEAERAEFERLEAEYSAALQSYNEKVQKWNERGGAPPKVVEELERESAKLGAMVEELEAARQEVNDLVKLLNSIGDRGNEVRYEYNQKANTYTERYGGSREFKQGRYVGDAINIYQFNELSDLRLVMAHEFGHALGLDHVGNPESVMYSVMRDQNLSNISLSPEDQAAVRKLCGIEA